MKKIVILTLAITIFVIKPSIAWAEVSYYPEPPYTYSPYDASISRVPESGAFYVGQEFIFGCSWNTKVYKVPEYSQVSGGGSSCPASSISFVATEPGTYEVRINPFNAFSPYGLLKFSFDVNPDFAVITTSLPDATINAGYSQILVSNSEIVPLVWSISGGNLPLGLNLDNSSGVLYGTPSEVGTFNFIVQVDDANSVFRTRALSLVVNPTPLIVVDNLSIGTINGMYYEQLEVLGGSSPFSWDILSGGLPDGLSLNADTGAISGSPLAIGNYSFTVQVSDLNGVIDTESFSITIVESQVSYYPESPYTYTPYDDTTERTPSSGPFYVGQEFTFTCGDWAMLVFKVPEYTLMVGSTACSGPLSFTATQPGTYEVRTNPFNAFSPLGLLKFSFDVVAPEISTGNLADGFVGIAYSQILEASGANPLLWSLISGSFPSGLTLNSTTGEISGTPTTVETSNFTVQVTDANNNVATKDLSIVVHGNTSVGTNVLVGPLNGVTLNFSDVTQEGQTTVTTSGTGQPPPTGFKLGNPPTYYSISTTAVFTPPVEVCISWTQGQFNNENNLKLWHLGGSVWTDVTTSLDTVNNIICGLTNSFSDFAIFEKKQVVATIDIKPNTYPNTINLGSNGTVPVAILSTSTFDATTVDPLTVTLASAPVQLRGNGTAMYSFQDVNNDGLLDIVVHVSTEALQLSSTDTLANLVGYTSDNTEVIGSDTVRVVQ